MTDTITDLGASDLSRRIHARAVSCREVMQAYLSRIHALNPRYNAIVSMAPEEALLAQADACDRELAQGNSRGWLHGIPQAIKDTGDTIGFPSTKGCVLLKDQISRRDSIMAARMKAAGCIVIGKTNTPELGLGSHTFNELFGATRNAWDTQVTAGGSSGGAAVALAHRMLPVADGSDFMGSLRNPAGWNHVWGMRPTQGRIPGGPNPDVWIDQLAIEGPMARHAEDLGRLLLTQSGPDSRVPLSLHSTIDWTPDEVKRDAKEVLRGLRIGWWGDLGGYLAVEPGILDACSAALSQLEGAGAQVQPLAFGADPDAIWQCWLTWRRALVRPRVAPLLEMPRARELVKPEALWEHDCSLSLSFGDFQAATTTRTRLFQHMHSQFEQVDLIALPVAQVWPFAVTERWPRHIGSREMDTYHRWMECTIYATLAGMPAISMPAGFHSERPWPVGVQLIANHGDDGLLLRVASAWEQLRPELMARRPDA